MIQAVRGTKDILPYTVGNWQFIEDVFRRVSKNYGYSELRTPIFEKTEVFSRGIGDATDIVNKEMYTFKDKGDELITLRPEMTAALVRAVVQNSMLQQANTLRLWYFGPFFRYERPQKGRLRQFHQYGAECLGSPYPEADAECILLANALFREAGIKDFKLIINSLGDDNTRKIYKNDLLNYLNSVSDKLSKDSKERLQYNPLRILDSKDENDIAALQNAPKILDFLTGESKEHFDKVLEMLKEENIEPQVNPMLVRGLDYYCDTVFEFQSLLLGSQDSFGGGGRYNGLIEQLGGKPTPAVGFALGVERLLLILEELKCLPDSKNNTDVFIAVTNNTLINVAQNIGEILRKRKLSALVDLQQRTMKAQLREANRLSAKYTIIIGEEEYQRNSITIKNMITSEQTEIKIEDLTNFNLS